MMTTSLRPLLLALAILVALAPLSAQVVIPGTFDLFTTDEMGNVYALHRDELVIFDKRGRSGLRNSVKTFGRIQTIDAFYSLKPMVFSPEQGQLAVLDNTLSVQGSVMNLPRQGFPQVVLACMSVQNHFWLFDERELALSRVDGQLRTISDSGRLDQLLAFTPKPVSMQEHENRLYVNDPEQGILVFDLFGTYMRTIPILEVSSFQVRGNDLFHVTGGVFNVYNMRSFDVQPFPLPEGLAHELLDARVERGQAFLLYADRILIQDLQR